MVVAGIDEAGDAVTEKLGFNAPGTKAVFYGLILMVIITLRPSGVWPWLVRVFGLTGRKR